ncbi:RING finger and transmembrane domain-containing protein 2 isoform X1 [Hylaeus volcanicus]|uniref:RING finger and transmembrane domain-containing protein 2 isoform X1 n=1 Tax=Hylaeus volcanicus TaxID=313075 RepID=UPI0023B842E3|nr:RING finger and transmembrane domain-containing protein 2 isoform X1 [Hylaeus volcanicus]XP_053982538.1 RING finger and transmembrane domain-containing protein 2 isoform X1 [Hylaeus volcanicus]
MADNIRLEEIIIVTSDTITSHTPNPSDTRQSPGLLMMHSSTAIRSAPSISTRGFNFGARTMEQSRMFANNISSTIEEIRPFIEHVRIQPNISLSSLLNIQRIQNSPNTIAPSSDNFIINVEDQPSGSHSHEVSSHDNHHVGENQNNNTNIAINHNNNNNSQENSTETIQISPETRALITVLQRYAPFVLILLAKGLYDYRAGILNFVVLLVAFNHANDVVKREIGKQHNKSWTSLLFITCHILGSMFFINPFESDTHIFSSYTQPLTVWELLWSVLITDFILKLITIICKIFVTCLPAKILALRKRGKYYLMIEATSQLYRCGAPIQSWLYYFFEAYQGPEKILGVLFSVVYTVSKGNDLLSRAKFFQTAIRKLFQNVNLGVSPSKEELIASGGICAICHDEYSIPVILHCKHIFCETCVLTWLDKERTCPLCRANITDDPTYRDGHTTYFVQLY